MCTKLEHDSAQTQGYRRPTVCLVARGNLDMTSLVSLQDRCLRSLHGGATAVQLDFTAMTGCPNALLATLTRLGAVFRIHNAHLQLIGLEEAVRTIALRPTDAHSPQSTQ